MKNFLKASALVAIFAATLTSCDQKPVETTTTTEPLTMDATTTPTDTTVVEVAPIDTPATTETAPMTTDNTTTTTTAPEVK